MSPWGAIRSTPAITNQARGLLWALVTRTNSRVAAVHGRAAWHCTGRCLVGQGLSGGPHGDLPLAGPLAGSRGFAAGPLPSHTELSMPALSPTMSQVHPSCAERHLLCRIRRASPCTWVVTGQGMTTGILECEDAFAAFFPVLAAGLEAARARCGPVGASRAPTTSPLGCRYRLVAQQSAPALLLVPLSALGHGHWDTLFVVKGQQLGKNL